MFTSILIALLVAGLIFWVLSQPQLPIAEPFLGIIKIIIVVILVILIIWLLKFI